MLVQIFHAFQRTTSSLDTPALQNFRRQTSVLPLPVASSPENWLPSFSLVQLQLRIPSKSFFVYLIRAFQQLMPHFMVLALLLNPVHEDSEFV